MSWNGYVLIIVNAGIPANKLTDCLTALEELGLQSDSNPYRITHCKQSVDGREFILHITLDSEMTKAQAVTKLANYLGYTEQQITDAIDEFTIFAGNDLHSKGESMNAYISQDPAKWNNTE